jgi:hypothetical protein
VYCEATPNDKDDGITVGWDDMIDIGNGQDV